MASRRVLLALPGGVRRWLPYWLLAAGIFGMGAAVGGAVGAERETAVVVPVRASGDPVADVTTLGLFVHNTGVAARMVVGGVLGGVPTAYLLLFNGFALGSVVVDAAGTLGPLTTMALLVPHGVFELPAIWLAGAVPARWLHVVWAVASGRDRATPVPRVMLRTLLALVVVLALLALAAAVEATVTAELARAL
jgi:stage II sporulation protein M